MFPNNRHAGRGHARARTGLVKFVECSKDNTKRGGCRAPMARIIGRRVNGVRIGRSVTAVPSKGAVRSDAASDERVLKRGAHIKLGKPEELRITSRWTENKGPSTWLADAQAAQPSELPVKRKTSMPTKTHEDVDDITDFARLAMWTVRAGRTRVQRGQVRAPLCVRVRSIFGA